MEYSLQLELLVRLLVAACLGGIIGVERERGARAAGLRTNILVCMGSTLIMLVSIYGFLGHEAPRDPARMAAQVVSGIGFLGAGTILHEGLTIKGLTTAATLWVVAAIGLAVGSGMFVLGVGTTLITLITLTFFRKLEKQSVFLDPKTKKNICVIVSDKTIGLNNIINFFSKNSINFKIIRINNGIAQGKSQIEFVLTLTKDQDLNSIVSYLTGIYGVVSVDENIE